MAFPLTGAAVRRIIAAMKKRGAIRFELRAGHSQTRHAYREVLRLVHAANLLPGDRLPPQSELGRALGLCQGTLSAAMNLLVADGVVSRRQRLGTVLLRREPANPQRRLWTVGIVMPEFTGPFFPVLTYFLHRRLIQAGCSDRAYMVMPGPRRPSRHAGLGPAYFAGLEEDLEDGVLDGVITPTTLQTKRVPVCAIAGFEIARFGVLIDQAALVTSACAELTRRGCRRLAVVTAQPPGPGNGRCWAAFVDASRLLGRPATGQNRIVVGAAVEGGVNAARQLLALPANRRPDGLIVLDDVIAQSLTATLREAGPYRPLIAAQTNAQSPLSFALPVLSYAVDVEALADRAVTLLVSALLNPHARRTVEWATPVLAQ